MTRLKDDYRNAYTERLLNDMSPTNQKLVRAFLQTKRASGAKPGTLMSVTVSLSHLDSMCAGTRIQDLSMDALTSFLETYTRSHQHSSADTWAVHVKNLYGWLNDDEIPRCVSRALKRIRRAEWGDPEAITTEERDALLKAAAQIENPATRAKWQAIIWTLWDSGFRLGELLALRVGSIVDDPEGGAHLQIPAGSAGLKTGPRRVLITEAPGPIRLWLAHHPFQDDPNALMYPGRHGALAPMWEPSVNKKLAALAKQAGIRHIWPHLFRHSRATRAARDNWSLNKMNKFFGWSPQSLMAARYMHLNHRDVDDQVRKDSNLDPLGALIQKDPRKALTEAVSAAVAETLRQEREQTRPRADNRAH